MSESAQERWEAFYNDGEHNGALFRRVGPEQILTRIAFGLGDGEFFRAESQVMRDGETWLTAHYRQEPGGVDTHISREAAGLGEDTLPGYAEFLLLTKVAGSGAERLEFGALEDSNPASGPRPAVIAREGTTTVRPPGGEAQEVEVITVRGEGLSSAHWVADGQIIGSDWQGATSFLATDETAALDGVPAPVAEFLTSGFVAS